MANFNIRIIKVVTGGPYAYEIFKDGVGQKSAIGLATISLAMDGVKTDVAGMLGGETVQVIGMNVSSS